MRKSIALFTAGLVIALGASAVAADFSADQLVKYRKAYFDSFAGHLEAISLLAQNLHAFPDSGTALQANVAALRMIDTLPFEAFTPESKQSRIESSANPAIWDDPEGFKQAQVNYKAAVDNLWSAVNRPTIDATSLGEAVGEVGQACKACHLKYRSMK